MARWFIQDRRGFLVLDDTLVDLDPERQRQAAAMLRKFAEDKQVLLMTCHPSHAEVLGGEVIEV
jgi:exonuclease SbcC